MGFFPAPLILLGGYYAFKGLAPKAVKQFASKEFQTLITWGQKELRGNSIKPIVYVIAVASFVPFSLRWWYKDSKCSYSTFFLHQIILFYFFTI